MADKMPAVAAFLDQVFEAFGKDGVRASIKESLGPDACFTGGRRPGEGGFWAVEGVDGVTGEAIWTDPRTVVYGFPWCRWPRGGPCEAPVSEWYARNKVKRKKFDL